MLVLTTLDTTLDYAGWKTWDSQNSSTLIQTDVYTQEKKSLDVYKGTKHEDNMKFKTNLYLFEC